MTPLSLLPQTRRPGRGSGRPADCTPREASASGQQRRDPALPKIFLPDLLLSASSFCLSWPWPRADPSPAILQELRSFREMGSVLLVAAHPDDEDSSLIAFLARGRYCRTAYLSITRGDGGQNVLGPEIGDELGVIRTQELLAARRIDGGQQFFTRARDFGYSKDYRETFKFWDEKEVLSDVVRVMRTFRPDVVIPVFSTNPAPGQHGHHTASAILAGEAFKLAGDTNAFPEQLRDIEALAAQTASPGPRTRADDGSGRGIRDHRGPQPLHAQNAGLRQLWRARRRRGQRRFHFPGRRTGDQRYI